MRTQCVHVREYLESGQWEDYLLGHDFAVPKGILVYINLLKDNKCSKCISLLKLC